MTLSSRYSRYVPGLKPVNPDDCTEVTLGAMMHATDRKLGRVAALVLEAYQDGIRSKAKMAEILGTGQDGDALHINPQAVLRGALTAYVTEYLDSPYNHPSPGRNMERIKPKGLTELGASLYQAQSGKLAEAMVDRLILQAETGGGEKTLEKRLAAAESPYLHSRKAMGADASSYRVAGSFSSRG